VIAAQLDRAALLADLVDQVHVIERDLDDRLNRGELPDELVDLKSAHAKATAAQRTAADFDTWRAGEVTQSAVAWVLGTSVVGPRRRSPPSATVSSSPPRRWNSASMSETSTG
jgi:hypothetical protein